MKKAQSKKDRAPTPAQIAHKPSMVAEPSPPPGWSRIEPLYPAVWTGKTPMVGALMDVEPIDRETQQMATVFILLEPTEVEDRAASKLRQARRGEPVHVLGACLLKLRSLKSEAGHPVLRVQRGSAAKVLVVDQRDEPMPMDALQALLVEGQSPPPVPEAKPAVS